jgi:hypothetical protein
LRVEWEARLVFAFFLLIESSLQDVQDGQVAVSTDGPLAWDFLHQTEVERRDETVQFHR